MEETSTLVLALIVLSYALASKLLRRWWVNMPTAMLVAGLAVGASGLRLVDLDVSSSVVKSVAEVTLSLMLFHDACRIGLSRLRRQTSLPLRLLGIGLPMMILGGTAAARVFFPHFGWVVAALIATMLAPTDAALGEEIVVDERLPAWLRQGLNVESGLNDGLCVPIFLVLLEVVGAGGWQRGAVIAEFGRVIGFGVLVGGALGVLSGFLMRVARAHSVMLAAWTRYGVLAAALACYIGAALLGGSGFIGAFVGGLVFGTVSGQEDELALGLTGQLGTTFDAVAFVLLGAVLVPVVLPFVTWAVVIYAVLSLAVIRMVAVMVASIASGAAWQTILLMGWFGPRGLATVVFAVMLLESDVPDATVVASVAIVGVVMSVIAHGFSAPGLAGRYARWYSSQGQARVEMPEHRTVELPASRGFVRPHASGNARKSRDG